MIRAGDRARERRVECTGVPDIERRADNADVGDSNDAELTGTGEYETNAMAIAWGSGLEEAGRSLIVDRGLGGGRRMDRVRKLGETMADQGVQEKDAG